MVVREQRSVRRATARALAAASAAVWAGPFFGLVDLTTVLVERGPEWRSGYLLEAGWGLLFTVLVALPLGVLVARPGDPAATGVLALVAVALVVAGAWASAGPQLLTALVLAADVALVAAVGGVRRPAARAPEPAPIVLAAATAVGALAYGRDALSGPTVLSVTVGVDHHGVQAALGLAVAGCVALAAVAPSRLPAWCAVGCLAWLAALSLAYPDVDGSLGTRGAAVGLALAAAVGVTAAAAGRHQVIPRRAAGR
jgi:hypothetical protein